MKNKIYILISIFCLSLIVLLEYRSKDSNKYRENFCSNYCENSDLFKRRKNDSLGLPTIDLMSFVRTINKGNFLITFINRAKMPPKVDTVFYNCLIKQKIYKYSFGDNLNISIFYNEESSPKFSASSYSKINRKHNVIDILNTYILLKGNKLDNQNSKMFFGVKKKSLDSLINKREKKDYYKDFLKKGDELFNLK
mgnify:CR=1 FL=1